MRVLRCPKCGGESGYQYRFAMSCGMRGAWGGDPHTSDDDRITRHPENASCIDCNARVRIDVASGEADDAE